jgi:hypothetical protein
LKLIAIDAEIDFSERGVDVIAMVGPGLAGVREWLEKLATDTHASDGNFAAILHGADDLDDGAVEEDLLFRAQHVDGAGEKVWPLVGAGGEGTTFAGELHGLSAGVLRVALLGQQLFLDESGYGITDSGQTHGEILRKRREALRTGKKNPIQDLTLGGGELLAGSALLGVRPQGDGDFTQALGDEEWEVGSGISNHCLGVLSNGKLI